MLAIKDALREYPYQFTRRWFVNRDQATFQKLIYPEWNGKPIKYLELGVFEGMSMVWMLNYVLTHPDSRAVGVDPWLMETKIDETAMEAIRGRAIFNTQPFREKCALVRANSNVALYKMNYRRGWKGIKPETVDIAMIDGAHIDLHVWNDARMVLPLMKLGGWMLFDDVENDQPKDERHVAAGVKMFAEESKDQVEFLWKDRYMECYRRIK